MKSKLVRALGISIITGLPETAFASDNPFHTRDLAEQSPTNSDKVVCESVCGGMLKTQSTSNSSLKSSKRPIPKNGRVAYSSIQDGNSEIYTVNPDGTDPRRLTVNPGVDTHPAFSDDGSLITYTSERDGKYDVWIMNSDGSQKRRVTNSPGKHNVPSFYPCGKRIVFQSTRGSESPQIYSIDIDGTHEVRLSHSAKKDMGPKVSPNGREILFSSNRAGENFDLYLMNADGTDVRRITEGVNNDFSRDWSPNGRKIVYNDNVNGTGQIFTMSLKTKRKRQLTFNPGTTPPFNPGEKYPEFSFGTLHGDVTPSWSPNGKRIAFASDREGPYEVYTVSITGKHVKKLTSTNSAQISTSWQPICNKSKR